MHLNDTPLGEVPRKNSLVLDNGVVFLSEPATATKTAAVGFWFSTGSRFEKPHQKGITHFTEHLLFKGTKTRSAYDIACAFDRMGGYINAFTERESVCMHCVVPSIHLKSAIEIMCDMTAASLFRKEDIEKERSVICSEIISAQDDPEEAALDTVSQTIWPSSSLSASISGSVDDVHNLKRDDLFSWYKTYFVTGELLVTLSGNFDKDEIAGLLKTLPQRPQIPLIRDLSYKKNIDTPLWNKGLFFEVAPFQMQQIFVLFPLPQSFSKNDYYAWCILNALIGDTMSSRLFQSLREEGGYCYNVYSFFSLYSDCGFWCAYASSSREKVLEVIKCIENELEKLRKEGFSDDEINAAKEHICGEEIINSEDVEQRMKKLSRLFSLGFESESTDETIKEVRSITKDQLHTAIKKILNTDKKNLLVYGPKIKRKIKRSIYECSTGKR